MATFLTIGYGDQAGYERTDQAVRAAAHAHDERLRASGARMGIAGSPVQVRNPDANGTTTTDGPFLRSDLPVAGFALIEADSIDEAVEAAPRPRARSHTGSSRSGRSSTDVSGWRTVGAQRTRSDTRLCRLAAAIDAQCPNGIDTPRRNTMARYLMSVWHDEEYVVDFTSDDMQRVVTQVAAFNDEVSTAGAWVFGTGLQPASSATVFTASESGVSMTDGPYAETKEQMGGFRIIDVADLDTACRWAGKAAAACEGPVELRPMQDD